MADKPKGGGPSWLGGAESRQHGGSGPSWITGGSSSAAPPEHHSGGLLSTLKHIVTQTPADLANAAYNAPGGIYHAAKEGVIDPAYNDIRHGPNSKQAQNARAKSNAIGKGIVTGSIETAKHPLRHPGDTALLFLPVVGRVAKLGEAAALAKNGAKAGDVLKAATKGVESGPRELHIGETTVRGHYSRAAGGRVVQKLTDRALEKGAAKHVRVENVLHRRAAKWETRNQRTADAVARAPGTTVAALGSKLKPDELRALRLVAEETPVERRLGAQEMRKGRATSKKEQARHQERIDLTRAAMQHLTSDGEGRPIFKPEATKLRAVYKAIQKASADREGILKNLNLMDDAAAQAAKTKTARLAAGGSYEKPTPSKLGTPSRSLVTVQRRVASLQGRVARSQEGRYRTPAEAQKRLTELNREENIALDKIAGGLFGKIDPAEVRFRNAENARAARQASGVDRSGRASGASGNKATTRRTVTEQMRGEAAKRVEQLIRSNPDHPVARRWMQRSEEIAQLQKSLSPDLFDKIKKRDLGHVGEPTDPKRHADLQGALAVAERDLASAEKGRVSRMKPTGIVGAEDITPSPNAVHIGNPVERTKLRGKPKISSTGTLGHTQKPSSLKVSTGGSLEHALERNDVTNLIAERHSEAARLGKIDRIVQKFKNAGELVPRRKDDVWMWTDKVVSNERIPKEVRGYLDNPESIAKLPPDEQHSIYERVRDATLEQHDWRDQAKLDEFTALAKKGKGVFVPRRLLGEYAKSDYQLSGIPGMKFADAVNNAQKAGLIYLKLNYPVIQGVSNAAMNLIHQGFAYPRNITAAIRLEKKVGPEYAAITDDIMGQGAVLQAGFEGQGTVSRASQKLAHIMSSKVDTPARRAAFYHEAAKAGYGTPEKYRALLEDNAHAGDLAEVAQRAREAIVDYGDLSPFERAVVRRLVFVYPWQKGATKYAGHFLRDHPVQAAAMAQLGELGKKNSDQAFGPVPSYLKGLIPVGDKAVNPAGVNFFQTPAQIGTAAGGLLTGKPSQASAGLGFLSPAPGIVAGLLSGHDDIGRPLKGNIAAKARDLTIAQTPAAALARAAGGQYNLVRALVGSQRSSKTFPDKNDPYWRFVLGGLYPRRYDRGALNQNAARDKTGR